MDKRRPLDHDFITALYYGEIETEDRRIQPMSVQRRRENRRGEASKAFLRTLTPEQEKLYDAYDQADADVRESEMLGCFIDGFRLGGQCVYDIFVSQKAPGENV